ncbi:MAG: hypothetical protein JKY09_04760, partial [Crocinitomicaceae bacterium]|nr:hypothetical protein [Crocinitomicaceae bacterium]
MNDTKDLPEKLDRKKFISRSALTVFAVLIGAHKIFGKSASEETKSPQLSQLTPKKSVPGKHKDL